MILLINPKTTKSTEFQTEFFREPNLGILYLAAVLERQKLSVEILDLEQYYLEQDGDINSESIKDVILEKVKRHDIIGITSLTNTFFMANKIAELIKKSNREKIVVLGGPHVSFQYEDILKTYSIIDFICVGESETSFLELVNLINRKSNGIMSSQAFERNLEAIKGLAYRNLEGNVKFSGLPNPIDIETIPIPSRYLLSQENFYYRVASVLINRGCPNACSFCSRQKLFPKTRIRRLDSIFTEIRDIISFQTYNYINFYDNININRTFFQDFCRLFIDNKIEIPWGCELRVDSITGEEARLLKEAGCRLIATGIESASLSVLKNNLKYQDPKQVLAGIKYLKAVDIPVQAYFVLGLPGETELTFHETLDFIKNLPLDDNDKINYFVATPYPGSRLWDERENFNINIIEFDFTKYDCQHIIFETSDLSVQKLEKLYKIAKDIEQFFERH
ncbi:MAG: B12-binding domain-containing radical SAM protein [Candidatus Lokiarchaeota archaeon]|nr:B12-binding domain-containing radical SAM protein [Candidatus Lokiarchaeota archaeon]